MLKAIIILVVLLDGDVAAERTVKRMPEIEIE
jgi:hypothetical protein